MISKKFKISKKNFTQYIRGKHVNFSMGAIVFSKKPSLNPGFAVVIPKKVSKKAHDRNAIKRFYYALLRDNLDFFINNQTSVVILFKNKITDMQQLLQKENKDQLKKEFNTICLK